MDRKLLFIALLITVIGIGVLHFTTPGELIFYHNTYRRLSYFPIILGAIWFGVGGGVILAVLSSIAFIPHLLLFAGQGLQSYYSELTEIILYLAAGFVVGLIAGRERRLRERIEKTSLKLEKSYEALYKGTAQLIEAEEQLAATQRMSALGEMAASLAHEIKNPLSSIKGTAEILLDDYPQEHPKREFVEILLKETGRLNTTLENVLGYAGNTAVNQNPDESLAAVILRQKKLMEPVLNKKNVDIELQNLEAGDEFFVVGFHVSQVFLNIFINGAEALEKTAGARMIVDVSHETGGCRVDVHDNGPGVSEADREKIFEPFFSRRENGTGLGLLISRKIVESYGGNIDVSESDLGGACFSVFLPRKRGTETLDTYIAAGT